MFYSVWGFIINYFSKIGLCQVPISVMLVDTFKFNVKFICHYISSLNRTVTSYSEQIKL